MVLAIPLQGIAGLSDVACAGHHQSVFGDAVASEADGHDHGAAHVDHNTHDASDTSDGPVAESAHQKCGGCGPCCIGAVMASSSQPTHALVSGKTDFPKLSSRHASPAVRGLDRPPQTVQA